MRWPGGASGQGGGPSARGSRAGIVGEGRAELHGDEKRDVRALGRELLAEREEGGRLAHLPGGVHDEVQAVVHEAPDLRQAGSRRQGVVTLGLVGAGGVEEAGHPPALDAGRTCVNPSARRPDPAARRRRLVYAGSVTSTKVQIPNRFEALQNMTSDGDELSVIVRPVKKALAALDEIFDDMGSAALSSAVPACSA
jgi:hypothetical protein